MKREKLLLAGSTLFLTVSLMGLSWLLGGCAARVAHVTDLPPGVTEQQAKDWDTAVAKLHEIATATSSLRQAVFAARGAGAFPDDNAYTTTLRAIAKMDQSQLAASRILRAAPQRFGTTEKQAVASYVQGISDAMQTLNAGGVTNIKNPDRLQSINKLIATLSQAATVVVALVQ